MAIDIFDKVRQSFSASSIQDAAEHYNENTENLRGLLHSTISAVLSGVLHLHKNERHSELSSMCTTAASLKPEASISIGGGPLFRSLNSSYDSLLNKGTEWVQALFGEKSEGLVQHLSEYDLGVKRTTASSLLNVVTPQVLASIGSYIRQHNTSPAELSAWLASEQETIQEHIPARLNLSALGLPGHAGPGIETSQIVSQPVSPVLTKKEPVAPTPTPTPTPTPAPASSRGGGMGWLWWLLVLIILVLILFFVVKQCKKGDGNAKGVADTSAQADSGKAMSDSTHQTLGRESLKVKLPDGTELDAYKGGIEDVLVQFLNDPTKKGGKNEWFDFDNLNFEEGSAKITAESNKQIDNIVAILKAYPKLKIKIGGYTDKTGTEDINIKLSTRRAGVVDSSLKAKASNAAQLEGSEGYGSKFAKAEASAPDSVRAKDRRISVCVREK